MSNTLNFKKVLIAGFSAAAVSAVINSLLYFVFHAVGWITDDVFVQPGQPLTIASVIMASILPSIVGSLVYALFAKFSSNGFKIFRMVAIILMVLSLALPFVGIPNAPTMFALSLEPMHLVVPLILLYFLGKSRRSNDEGR